MNWLSRLFPPRWQRLSREGDILLCEANVFASRGAHGSAAARFIAAANKYTGAAATCPTEWDFTLRLWASQCFKQGAAACDSAAHDFKPVHRDRPELEPMATQQQGKS